MSSGSETKTPDSTLRGRNWPTIRQFAVFVENRVGQLLEIVRLFDGTKVRVVALSIADAVDFSVVRMVLTHPEQGRELLERAGLAIAESDLIGVQLPMVSQPIINVCMALLQAEVNIHYAYPLLVQPQGCSALALHVDNLEMGMQTLVQKRFNLITEADLMDDDE